MIFKWNMTGSGIGTGPGRVRALIIDSNAETANVPNDTGQAVMFDASKPTPFNVVVWN